MLWKEITQPPGDSPRHFLSHLGPEGTMDRNQGRHRTTFTGLLLWLARPSALHETTRPPPRQSPSPRPEMPRNMVVSPPLPRPTPGPPSSSVWFRAQLESTSIRYKTRDFPVPEFPSLSLLIPLLSRLSSPDTSILRHLAPQLGTCRSLTSAPVAPFFLVCCTPSTMRRYASLGPLACLAWLSSAAVVPRR
jgi:hypothetical protein